MARPSAALGSDGSCVGTSREAPGQAHAQTRDGVDAVAPGAGEGEGEARAGEQEHVLETAVGDEEPLVEVRREQRDAARRCGGLRESLASLSTDGIGAAPSVEDEEPV